LSFGDALHSLFELGLKGLKGAIIVSSKFSQAGSFALHFHDPLEGLIGFARGGFNGGTDLDAPFFEVADRRESIEFDGVVLSAVVVGRGRSVTDLTTTSSGGGGTTAWVVGVTWSSSPPWVMVAASTPAASVIARVRAFMRRPVVAAGLGRGG